MLQSSATHQLGDVSIKNLRDYILDNSLSEKDTIIVNQINFDELALEYRRTYGEGITLPFFIVRVLIKEDLINSVSFGRIQVVKRDQDRFYEDYIPKPIESGPNSSHEFDEIYRCGNCGDIVEYNGNKLEDAERSFRISVFEKFKTTITVKHTTGYCCRHLR